MNKKPRTVKDWWAENPQTYGTTHGKTATYYGQRFQFGDREFFERLDQEFYSWNTPLHDAKPFDRLFPYDDYGSESRVLEIGCGLGTMLMNWARNGCDATGVDLNPTSVEQTRARFDLHGLQGDISECDARSLPFEDESFDYVYSWGVLHHSPDLHKSIQEMMRVTKKGGGFGIMLYHRRSLLHWYLTEYLEGFLHGERRFLDSLQLASRYGDGYEHEGNPHTWPVTRSEMTELFTPFSHDFKIKTLGTELDSLFKLLLPGLGMVLPRCIKKVWARRFGWSIWGYGHKE